MVSSSWQRKKNRIDLNVFFKHKEQQKTPNIVTEKSQKASKQSTAEHMIRIASDSSKTDLLIFYWEKHLLVSFLRKMVL